MIHKIAHEVYKAIRKHGDLSIVEVAAAIGRERQIVYRIENGEQLLMAEQEASLVKRANLSRMAFVEIMCKVLSKFLGRRVIIAPQGQFLSASPLARAADVYSLHQEKLDPEVRERIEAKLHQGRLLDTATDQTCSLFEKEIRLLIKEALGFESLVDDDD